MLDEIMAIINGCESFGIGEIVEILNIILKGIFGFIGESEGWETETTEG